MKIEKILVSETLTRIEVVKAAFSSDDGGELEVNTIVNDILVLIRIPVQVATLIYQVITLMFIHV